MIFKCYAYRLVLFPKRKYFYGTYLGNHFFPVFGISTQAPSVYCPGFTSFCQRWSFLLSILLHRLTIALFFFQSRSFLFALLFCRVFKNLVYLVEMLASRRRTFRFWFTQWLRLARPKPGAFMVWQLFTSFFGKGINSNDDI